MAREEQKILTLQRGDVVCDGITVEMIFLIMRHMQGHVNFFGELDVAPGRCVYGGGSWNCHGRDKDTGIYTLSRDLGCVVNENWFVWKARFFYSGIQDYFHNEEPYSGGTFILTGLGSPLKTIMKTKDLRYMEVTSLQGRASFLRDVRGAVKKYEEQKGKIDNYQIWRRAGLTPKVQCFECGHSSIIDMSVLFKQTDSNKIFALKNKLRCGSCGCRGSSEVLPMFRSNNRYSISKWKGYINGIKSSAISEASDRDEMNLYDVLGGDGSRDVYLGDGTLLTPEDKWKE